MGSIKRFWLDKFSNGESKWWKQKKESYRSRNADVLRIQGAGHIFQRLDYDNKSNFRYLLYLSVFIKQKDYYFVEERVIPFQFELVKGSIVNHRRISKNLNDNKFPSLQPDSLRDKADQRFIYDRRSAVRYAERWWNSYNPAYEKFVVDCTNYVSQCLFAGGAPMRGAPVRDQGWWCEGNSWSYSWTVAHSLRWYLGGSTVGLQGKEVQLPSELSPGDVICYDFQGDGKWDHNTIVVAIDAQGMPLVNAHTDNSRHRYWSYEDSAAWTPNVKYKFFRVGE